MSQKKVVELTIEEVKKIVIKELNDTDMSIEDFCVSLGMGGVEARYLRRVLKGEVTHPRVEKLNKILNAMGYRLYIAKII